MAVDPKNKKYWDRIKSLQKGFQQAQKAGDFKRAKFLKRNLARIVAVPFDNRLRKLRDEQATLSRQLKKAPQAKTPAQINQTDLEEKELEEKKTRLEIDEKLAPKNAKPEIPGGLAPEAKRKDDASTQTPEQPENEEAGEEQSPNPSLRERLADAFRKQVINRLKKVTLQALKKVAVSLASNPWAWLIAGILLIAIIAIAIFTNFFGLAGKPGPCESGQCMEQATDPVKDRDWLMKFANISGMSEISKNEREKYLAGLTNDLSSIRNEVQNSKISNKVDIIAKIDNILTEINLYRAKEDASTGNKIVADVKSLVQSLRNNLPIYPGTTSYPFPPELIGTYGAHAHGKSLMHPASASGHNVITKNGSACDATDVFIKESLWGKKNVEVHPIFGGTVTQKKAFSVSSRKDIWLTIKDDQGYEMLYAHLASDRPSAQVNSKVTTKDVIGIISNKHLHLEANYQGICLVTDAIDVQDDKSSSNPYGYYLWQHIKKTFKLSS